jgi:polysaccharide biosynthesis protein PelG
MAGIGFKLRELLSEESLSSTMKAYLIGAMVSCGPWIITFVVLAALNIYQLSHVTLTQMRLFQGILLYSYAFTLIIVGIFQMPVTRYVADLIYMEELDDIVPTFNGTVIVIGVLLTAVSATAVIGFTDWSNWLKLNSISVFVMIGLIWISMFFMSATKDYMAIIRAFGFGALLSVGAGAYLGASFQINGYLFGFFLGQCLIFSLLSVRLFIEFPVVLEVDFSFLRYLGKWPFLLLTGLLYQLSIWVDKFIFWGSKEGIQISHFIYASPLYDFPLFLAYITIIPALAIFLVRTETHFYEHYRAFYSSLNQKRSYRTISSEKEALITSVRRSFMHLIRRQGVLTLLVILLAPSLVEILSLDWDQLGILRITILAAFLQVLFQVQLTLLMYFEFHRLSTVLTLLFVLLNVGGTYWSLHLGLAFYGYGYFCAAFLVLLMGFPFLFYRMRNLDYLALMKQ